MKGHIRWRAGRAQLIVEGEGNADGVRKQHCRAIGKVSTRDADRLLRAFISEIESGFSGEGDKLCVREYVERWLNHMATKVRPSSVKRYRQLLERYVVARVGSRKLTEVRPATVQTIYDAALAADNRRKGTLSPSTVHDIHNVLYAALDQAMRWRLIVVNPCAAVTPPRVQRREMRALDAKEARKLIQTARGERILEALVPLVIGTGLRRGEALALRWSDLSADGTVAHIGRSLGPNGVTISPPKTPAGVRDVPTGATVRDAMRIHQARQLAELTVLLDGDELEARRQQRDGWVFTHPLGGAIKGAWLWDAFTALVKRAELGAVRFHDLRHTAGSLMLEAGIPIATVSKVLGHSSPAITMGIYAHSLRSSEDRVAGVMDAVLRGG